MVCSDKVRLQLLNSSVRLIPNLSHNVRAYEVRRMYIHGEGLAGCGAVELPRCVSLYLLAHSS